MILSLANWKSFFVKVSFTLNFLLEKMDEITNKVVFEDVDEVKEAKKKGRRSKRKALTSSANTANSYMLFFRCMGHDRGGEEAASAISRAFIELNSCDLALLEAADESWEEIQTKSDPSSSSNRSSIFIIIKPDPSSSSNTQQILHLHQTHNRSRAGIAVRVIWIWILKRRQILEGVYGPSLDIGYGF
nr:histidine phosphatase superfamily, clade-1 [Tanacetum cinerariifolium]